MIIEFKRVEDRVPHARGEAKCLDCQHEWEAVIESATVEAQDGWFDCPACTLEKARFKYHHGLAPGTRYWYCVCGGTLFNVTDTGLHCPNCGREQAFS